VAANFLSFWTFFCSIRLTITTKLPEFCLLADEKIAKKIAAPKCDKFFDKILTCTSNTNTAGYFSAI
jgi:hypothetical protein